MTDPIFTKELAGLLGHAKGLADWGIERGHTTAEQLRLTVEARREKVRETYAAVQSVRDTAKLLDIPKSTVHRDLSQNGTDSVPSSDTPPDRDTRRDDNRRQREATKAKPVIQTPGRFDCIVIDPPWQMEKIERDVRPNQVGFDYPTMSEEELVDFPVPDMADHNCHLFCWTTQKFLPAAMRLIGDWKFRYVCTFVWHKAGGFQPTGLPQFNCEFVLYARRGSPKFVDTKGFPTCFNAPRREHSRKPDEFYDMLRLVTAGRRIDVFSREAREGFSQYGNEVDKFNE